jgi:general stress protein 26
MFLISVIQITGMEKNLQNEEAIKKFKKLVDDVNICMFITKPEDEESARPMATIKVEDDGTLWFFTHKSSGKTSQLDQDSEVHLVYAHPGKDSYMDVWAKGSVVTDRSKIRELWNPIIKAWFPNGVDDPDLCLLRVKPESAYYWDNETGKMVEFLRMIAAAVTGKRLAETKEGDLDMNSR